MVLDDNKYQLKDERVVGKDQGMMMARQFGTCTFMETSAKAKIGVTDVSIFERQYVLKGSPPYLIVHEMGLHNLFYRFSLIW